MTQRLTTGRSPLVEFVSKEESLSTYSVVAYTEKGAEKRLIANLKFNNGPFKDLDVEVEDVEIIDDNAPSFLADLAEPVELLGEPASPVKPNEYFVFLRHKPEEGNDRGSKSGPLGMARPLTDAEGFDFIPDSVSE